MNKKWFVVIAGLILLFIILQSVLPQSVSAAESEWLRLNLINPIVRSFGGVDVGQDVVRKVAHSIEFGILSIFLVFLWNGKIQFCILTGFIIAFLDESLQLITGRGAEIKDVWIDLIGVAIGTAIGFLIWKIIKSRKTAHDYRE